MSVYCSVVEEFVENKRNCPPRCRDRDNPKRCPLEVLKSVRKTQ